MTFELLKFPAPEPPEEPDHALADALVAELTAVVIVGWDKDGNLYCEASENIDGFQAMWLLTHAQHELIARAASYDE